MIAIQQLIDLHRTKTATWHEQVERTETNEPWAHIEENHYWNFLLWHEEDMARIKDIADERIVLAKRNIDGYNQRRNNAMEKMDEWILNRLQQQGQTNEQQRKLHSETPGMMIDRLSIMALKRYHMEEETLRRDAEEQHIAKCKSKVATLEEQIKDLVNCLEDVLKQLESGSLRFKVYRQFKMYNDPALNPELYKRKQPAL